MKLLVLALIVSVPAVAQTPVVTGGTTVVPAPSQGASTITPSTCTGSLVSNGIKSDGTVNCVAPTATLPPNSNAQLGTLTTVQANSTAVVDQATTGIGGNGFANVLGGACVGTCDIMASPAYVKTDLSHYFLPAKDGSSDQYAQFPGQGVQIDLPRFAEDRRQGNRYWTAINSQPLTTSIYSDRTPFVFEHRTSNSIGYGYNVGVAMFRLRAYDGGHNYGATGSTSNNTQKSNFNMLVLDGRISHAGQGGCMVCGNILHTSQGDLMWHSAIVQTMGASEAEDERTKAARDFYGTTPMRFGGTISAAPTVVNADGFGLATFHVTQTSGYVNALMAATDMPLVNLSQVYNGSSADAFTQSIYPGFMQVPIRDAATVASTYGTSTFTTLTADISNVTYSAGCPSTIVSAAPLALDPMTLNAIGQGGMRVCATFGSTSGMTSGMKFSIGSVHSNFEIAMTDTIVDATHAWIKATKYHGAGEAVGFGGAQGLGFNLPGDDIVVGAMADYGQPASASFSAQATTLHKYTYVLGNDNNNLYVYLDSAFANEYSTTQYQATTPVASASLGTAVLTGTALTSISVTSGGNYSGPTQGNNVAIGQQTFAPPTITVDPSGTACTQKPLVHAVYGVVNYLQTVASIAIDSAGTCQSVPALVLQKLWTTPYRLAPATVTEKIVDPATGSSSQGYLLTDPVDASRWPAGSAVEIVGWLHDDAAGNESFGKYFTGASKHFGFHRFAEFQGNYAAPDTLFGLTNVTDGHKYYADATHPAGPGVAYEMPPDAYGFGGDFKAFHHFYLPPSDAVTYIDCTDAPGGHTIYHPCKDGVLASYNLYHFHSDVAGSGFDYLVTFNPSNAAISFPGPITAPSSNVVNASAVSQANTHLVVGDGFQAAYNPQTAEALIVAANATVLNGFLGAALGFGGCGYGQLPSASPCPWIGGIEAALDLGRSNYSRTTLTTGNHNDGTLATRIPVLAAWEDGMVDIGGKSFCAGFEKVCNPNDSWATDVNGNWRMNTLKLKSAPSLPCSSTQNSQTFNVIAGGTGVKDILQFCAKDATDTYAWRNLY